MCTESYYIICSDGSSPRLGSGSVQARPFLEGLGSILWEGPTHAPAWPGLEVKAQEPVKGFSERRKYHCSPESNLVNFGPPKKPTTDSECSWHGDFGSEVGFGASSSATETVISL